MLPAKLMTGLLVPITHNAKANKSAKRIPPHTMRPIYCLRLIRPSGRI